MEEIKVKVRDGILLARPSYDGEQCLGIQINLLTNSGEMVPVALVESTPDRLQAMVWAEEDEPYCVVEIPANN